MTKQYNNSYTKSRTRTEYDLKCNEDFFCNLNTENSAYWAGFILADGNINKYCTRICLSIKDLSHLEKFKKVIESEHAISITTTKKQNKEFMFCNLSICRKKMSEDLIYHGIGKDKSEICFLPPSLNERYIRHFIRGLFDGDGSFYLTSSKDSNVMSAHFKISSPVIFILYQIQALLMKKCNLNRTKLDTFSENCASLVYNGNDEVRRIMNYLYDNSTIYLERKYNLFVNHYKEIDTWRNREI